MTSSDRKPRWLSRLVTGFTVLIALSIVSPAFAQKEETNLVIEPALEEGEERPIEWFPGWEVGARVGWLFTSLDDLNEPVFGLGGNEIEPLDASGVMRIEGVGGAYISKKFKLDGVFGGAFSSGSDTSFSMWYLGLEPAVVFPEHRFEFHLGVRALFGGYTFEGAASDGTTKGYEGTGMTIEPNLTFRYIPTQEMGIDLSLGFWQFIALGNDPIGGAVDLDAASQASDNPLDWAAPSITLGIVYGSMPTRPEPALSPSGDFDEDGIINKDDECPRKAEDIDEFEDENGCPDDDNDNDGIADADDKCPDQAEDKDGVLDEDGCPEDDGDADGLLDEKDQCPEEPEDKDGNEDTDGCPDPDNDNDGIEDAKDKCPDHAEDEDGTEDEDGCPDIDDDKDYVTDDKDKCPGQPETWNGSGDDDGCPDEGMSSVKIDGKTLVLSKPFPFAARDTLTDDAKKMLDKVAVTLISAKHVRLASVIVHTDDKGSEDGNMKASVDRARAIKAYLVEKGVDEKRIVAKGFGASKPLVDPEGLKGAELDSARVKNKRLEITFNRVDRPPMFDPKTAPKTKAKKKDDKKDDK